MERRVRIVGCIVLALMTGGCGASRVVHVTIPPALTGPAPSATAARPPQDSLETFMSKVRTLAAEARPDKAPANDTAESTTPGLKAALAALIVAPTPQTYRGVAAEYAQLKIVDKAHQYLQGALALDPRDPATHDALARLWRDAGFPGLGLGDAYRALHLAPGSAAVHNTLGTVLQALGRRADARASYERALRLDATAAYALSNLCYGWVLDGQANRAVPACQRALELEPSLAAARNNLGLAYAVAGNLEAARGAFQVPGIGGQAAYNMGVVYLAHRHYRDAVDAFGSARTAQPTSRLVMARVQQAAEAARTGGD